MSSRSESAPRTVSLVTLGCARNEVDSEELAARLTAAGWELTAEADASVVLVNTCGFIQAAKQESINELLAAAESGAKVAAVGCLAERYGAELAGELPEAQILSFDDGAIHPIAYRDTPSFQIARRLLSDPDSFLDELLRPEPTLFDEQP